jgi:protein disulfide-isomerase
MRLARTFLLLAAASLTVASCAGSDPKPAAENVLRSGLAELQTAKKPGWVEFRADWCGWCRKMDQLFSTSSAAPILNKYYRLISIDIQRTDGAAALAKRLGSPNGVNGIPWFAVVDATGKVLATSEGPKGNVGYPGPEHEVSHFLSVLRTTAAGISDAELETVRAVFK